MSTEHIARRYHEAWTSKDGDTAFQMYDSVRVVEQLTIRDGAIASCILVTDTAAFGRFMA